MYSVAAFVSFYPKTMYKSRVVSNGVRCGMEPTKRNGSIRTPCWRTQLIVGGVSSVLGPLLDNYHSQFEVLRYAHPIELDFGLFGAHMHVTTAWFTSPLFALAGLIITNGVTWLDSMLGRGEGAEHMTMPMPKALATVCMFCSIYYLSGAISQSELKQYSLWILTALGLLEWYFMDGSVAGMIMGALTAVCGPIVEVGLINIGKLYSYTEWDAAGIPWMIAAVYFAGGPAVGNLARAVQASVRDKDERDS